MSETLNLVAIIDSASPRKIWQDLSRLPYIEETEEGLSLKPLKNLKDTKLRNEIQS